MVALFGRGGLAIYRMRIDIFPPFNLPQIYVIQNFNGMSPAQMEGLIVNQFELNFQYVDGVKSVESRSIQQIALIKLSFYPGTDMAQAMAEVVAQANRAQATMPPGVLPPQIMRMDAGSVPIGYLVLTSKTIGLGMLADLAQQRIRPLIQELVPGTVGTAPFGSNVRSIVINVDPDRLRLYNLTPEDVVNALMSGNVVIPAGNLYIKDQMPLVPTNAMVGDIQTRSKRIPLAQGPQRLHRRRGRHRRRHRRQLRLCHGERPTLGLHPGRQEEHRLDPDGGGRHSQGHAAFQERARRGRGHPLRVRRIADGGGSHPERGHRRGHRRRADRPDDPAVPARLAQRDRRGLQHPDGPARLAVRPVVTGNTINIMTLGGLALAIGMLVDEATVSIENIHVQMTHTRSLARAVQRGSNETAVPRLLAMLCILSVFIPAFIMAEPVRSLFVPLSLAVGFAMITSYLLSSTLVPVLAVWLLRAPWRPRKEADRAKPPAAPGEGELGCQAAGDRHVEGKSSGFFDRFRAAFGWVVEGGVRRCWLVVPAYLGVCALLLTVLVLLLGRELVPRGRSGPVRAALSHAARHQLRADPRGLGAVPERDRGGGRSRQRPDLDGLRRPAGAQLRHEQHDPVHGGPDDGQMRVALDKSSGVSVPEFRERLRKALPKRLKPWFAHMLRKRGYSDEQAQDRADLMKFGFEPGDIVSEVMSFGSPTPIEIVVSSNDLPQSLAFADKVLAELRQNQFLRDVQIQQTLDYPTVPIRIDRQKAGLSGVTTEHVGDSVLVATSSSRMLARNYWLDPKSGVSYQVQVQVPMQRMTSAAQVATIPLEKITPGINLMVRDVARVARASCPASTIAWRCSAT